MGRCAERLDLSDEQKERMKAIVAKHREAMQDHTEKVMEKRRALRAAVRAETVDTAAIQASAQELGEALGARATLRATLRSELRAVLTEEQRTQADARREKIREHLGRRGRGRGLHGPRRKPSDEE
jgi:Spy/CpxP family protein refolding chaperone